MFCQQLTDPTATNDNISMLCTQHLQGLRSNFSGTEGFGHSFGASLIASELSVSIGAVWPWAGVAHCWSLDLKSQKSEGKRMQKIQKNTKEYKSKYFREYKSPKVDLYSEIWSQDCRPVHWGLHVAAAGTESRQNLLRCSVSLSVVFSWSWETS